MKANYIWSVRDDDCSEHGISDLNFAFLHNINGILDALDINIQIFEQNVKIMSTRVNLLGLKNLLCLFWCRTNH